METNNSVTVLNNFIPFFKSEKYLAVLYGSVASGKTTSTAQKMVLRCINENGTAENPFAHKILIIRRHKMAIRHSVFQAIREVCHSIGIFDSVIISEPFLYYKFSNGAEIKYTDFENMHKDMHQATSIWIEEFSDFTLDELRNVLDDFVKFGYKGNEYYKQIVLTFNPYNRRVTLDDICNIVGKDNTFVLHSSYKDNKYLSQTIVDTIEKKFAVDSDLYKPIYLGIF